ncbi:MAG TPA: cytochrome c peroxidase [Gemmatimonadales bacterium]|nr:cytochrome c peroxidase [Gemmatimonadales bacterium]
MLAGLAGCADGTGPENRSALDRELRGLLHDAAVVPLAPAPAPDPALAALGRALMFDRILSGNRDVSCATCHHPARNTGDGLPFSIGTGGTGAGAARQLGAGRGFVARNSPALFNLGDARFTRMFWDGRVERDGAGVLHTPAGSSLPAGVSGPLAAQAMFPVQDRTEMRGMPGEMDVFGAPNELAMIDDDDSPAIWAALMARLLSVPEYVTLFQAAYPAVPTTGLGFQHAGNAIAAFETATWRSNDSPFDHYLAGDDDAMPLAARRGGVLFYGKARCVECHDGNLFTDQRFANIGVPQVGPGRGTEAPRDIGRADVSGAVADRYAFRTPSLRNTAITGPWMHDGAYSTLEGAVRHYLDVASSLQHYDTSQLPVAVQGLVVDDAASIADILSTLDRRVALALDLSDAEVADLVAFLEALTDPLVRERLSDIPASVPSGLPVDP